MRIALINQHSRIVGGVEQYLSSSVPLLAAAGHEVRLWAQDLPGATRDGRLVVGCQTEHMGTGKHDRGADLLAGLDSWRPDVVCVHSHLNFGLEAEIRARYPAIFFAHAYAATCISGGKTLHIPKPVPCNRRLGPGCLLHYYPHRCGGLNPVTMLRNYSRNMERRVNLSEYAAVVVFSSHMRAELARNGVSSEKIKLVPPFCLREPLSRTPAIAAMTRGRLQIGFIGRLEAQKGTDILLHALPRISRELNRPVDLVIAGDGRDRAKLQLLANDLMKRSAEVRIEFSEWLDGPHIDVFFSQLALLVVPSVWPEPFGLVGLEASARGIPAAAFAVGGITDWLIEGKNGHLAAGVPLSTEALAGAVAKCLSDPYHYGELQRGALEVASQFSAERHAIGLLAVLQNVAGANSSAAN